MLFSVSVLCLSLAQLANAASIRMEGESPVRWESSFIPYVIHKDGSQNLTNQEVIQTIQTGFQEWANLNCGNIDFTYLGPTDSKAVTVTGYPTNGQNEIVWIEDSTWPAGQFVLGITTTSSYEGGTIFESDIAFNGNNQKWSLDNSPNTADLLSVAAHEAGHFIGVQHSLTWPDVHDPPTMAPAADEGGKSRDLNADDILAGCFLYSENYSCVTDSDCPYILDDGPYGEYYVGQITCEQGVCGGLTNTVPTGDKELGDPCNSNLDCAEFSAFCQSISSTQSYCAKECINSNNTDCPPNFLCVGYTNAVGGVCLPEDIVKGNGEKNDGAPCSTGEECESLLCVSPTDNESGFCASECDPGTLNPCNEGYQCIPLPGVTFGACLPDEENSQGKYNGETCLGPGECISGLCVGGGGQPGYFCRSHCVMSDDNCSPEYHCVPFSDSSSAGACIPLENVKPGANLGDECASNSDCSSDICIDIEEGEGPGYPFCTRECGTCPCGLNCTHFSGGKNWCVPGPKSGCIPDGNTCQESNECVSDFCFESICLSRCDVLKPECSAGKVCQRLNINELNGVCENPGEYSPGSPCTRDEECSTLFCEQVAESNPICLKPCNTINPEVCGDALICLPLNAEVGGCVLESAISPDTIEKLRANAKTRDRIGQRNNSPAAQYGDDSPSPDNPVQTSSSGGCHLNDRQSHREHTGLFLGVFALLMWFRRPSPPSNA